MHHESRLAYVIRVQWDIALPNSEKEVMRHVLKQHKGSLFTLKDQFQLGR